MNIKQYTQTGSVLVVLNKEDYIQEAYCQPNYRTYIKNLPQI